MGNTVSDDTGVHRELLVCVGCGSNARFRGVMFAVQTELLHATQQPAAAATPRKELTGIGFSDSDIYAGELGRLFSYTNTYYHTDPRLDVMDAASVASYEPVDFVICSDVLEHVPPPAITAFENLRKLVKPGGVLILTVPFLEGYETIEHYPHLDRWRITQDLTDAYVVENLPPGGTHVERHFDPRFHGGPGQVLEMRVYGEGDLFARLAYAGFMRSRMLAPDRPSIGYVWKPLVEQLHWRGRAAKGYVIVCR